MSKERAKMKLSVFSDVMDIMKPLLADFTSVRGRRPRGWAGPTRHNFAHGLFVLLDARLLRQVPTPRHPTPIQQRRGES